MRLYLHYLIIVCSSIFHYLTGVSCLISVFVSWTAGLCCWLVMNDVHLHLNGEKELLLCYVSFLWVEKGEIVWRAYEYLISSDDTVSSGCPHLRLQVWSPPPREKRRERKEGVPATAQRPSLCTVTWGRGDMYGESTLSASISDERETKATILQCTVMSRVRYNTHPHVNLHRFWPMLSNELIGPDHMITVYSQNQGWQVTHSDLPFR